MINANNRHGPSDLLADLSTFEELDNINGTKRNQYNRGKPPEMGEVYPKFSDLSTPEGFDNIRFDEGFDNIIRTMKEWKNVDKERSIPLKEPIRRPKECTKRLKERKSNLKEHILQVKEWNKNVKECSKHLKERTVPIKEWKNNGKEHTIPMKVTSDNTKVDMPYGDVCLSLKLKTNKSNCLWATNS